MAAFQQTPRSSFVGEDVCHRLVAKSTKQGWAELPIGELVGKLGIELLGTPYVGHTLDVDDSAETCIINLDGLDCVTFFEDSLDLARAIKLGRATPEGFIDQVRFTRYRRGNLGDFTSRLHYTTDWVHDNVEKGVVRDLTPELPGALPFTQRVGYMSSHPESYRQLRAHPELVPAIAAMERRVNRRKKSYLPVDRIAAAQSLLKTGDIIGVATDNPGIDIAHTGLAYRDESGLVHFLDASSSRSKMKVTLEGPLSESVSWSHHNLGITVARPLEPREVVG